jgi:hypothetical protein
MYNKQVSNGDTEIYAEIDTSQLEIFEIDTPKIVVGIDVFQMSKIFKLMKPNDLLTIQYSFKDIHHIDIIIENIGNNYIKEMKISCLDLPIREYTIDNINFDNEITMNNIDFKQACKDFKALMYKEILIKKFKKQLTLSAKNGLVAEINQTFVENENISFKNNTDTNIVINKFPLNRLLDFSKLSHTKTDVMSIYFEKDKPLILKHNLKTLGFLYFIIHPIGNQPSNN